MSPSLRSAAAIWSLVLGLLTPWMAAAGATASDPQSRDERVQNLRAFAKLYGYVRYFHPSDEAQEIDWDRFAIYGVERVSGARNGDHLLIILEELFLPIAPTVHIYRSGRKPKTSQPLAPDDTSGLQVVAWQHRGVGYSPTGNALLDQRFRRTIYRSVRLKVGTPSQALFEAHPGVGEVAIRELGVGLTCEVPLALYSDETGTLGPDVRERLDSLQLRLREIDVTQLTAGEERVRLADVIIAWNVFQHFYPYFDVVPVDWDAELTRFLEEAIEDLGEREFFWTLSRLVAALQDGHGNVRHPTLGTGEGLLPAGVDWIEGRVVVTASLDTAKFRVGDVVLAADGVDAEEALLRDEEYVSGSP